MSYPHRLYLSRREFLKVAGGTAVAASLPGILSACSPTSGENPLKIGVLLPYSDIYQVLGENITAGMEMVFAAAQ